MTIRKKILPCLLLAALLPSAALSAEEAALPDAPAPQDAPTQAVTLRQLPRNLWQDQKAIWTSPRYINRSSAAGPVVLALAVALVATTDHKLMTEKVPTDAKFNDRANQASNGLLGGLALAPVALYGMGQLRHSEHASEAGLLAGESMINALVVSEVAKAVSLRQRPDVNGSRGKFFQSDAGMNSSFPSMHSSLAWASATAMAHEYPGLLPTLAAYVPALGVSATRVAARQHFPADAVAGSIIGWMIGRYVVNRHRHWNYDD